MKNKLFSYLLLIIIYILLLNISSYNEILYTNITYENSNCLINISKPVFKSIKINKFIDNYIDEKLEHFGKTSKSYSYCELNINYDVEKVDNHININFDTYSNIDEIRSKDTISYKTPLFTSNINEKEASTSILDNINTKTIDPSKKLIALTFDDGPSSIYTKEVLKVLKKHDITATFFIQGNKIKGNEDIIAFIYNEGHEIGSHGLNHRSFTSLTKEEIIYQIDTTNQYIKDITGVSPTLLRPPYGITTNTVKDNYDIVLWNIDSKDWKLKNSKAISRHVINKAFDGGIVLMHDTYKYTLRSLDTIITSLKEDGYEFTTVSNIRAYR